MSLQENKKFFVQNGFTLVTIPTDDDAKCDPLLRTEPVFSSIRPNGPEKNSETEDEVYILLG